LAVVAKHDSMRKELYHFSGEHKRFTQFIRASLERIRVRWSLIFVEQRVLSFTSSNELYFSCVRSQWQRPDRALASRR